MRKLVLLLAALAAFAARYDFDTPGKIVRAGDPQIAPGGKSIALTVTRSNFAENRNDTDIVLVDVATKSQRVLTFGRRGAGNPRWSPDGTQLAYTATIDSRAQVFVLPLAGGDSRQVTRAATGVQNFSWRPDGLAIAYNAFDEEPKKEGEERFNRAFEVQHNHYLMQEAPRPSHLWLQPLDGAPARRITSGSWTLPVAFPPGPPPPAASWAGNKHVAIVKLPTAYSGDFDRSQIQILDTETGAMRALTGRSKQEAQPVVSPDGTKVAYWFPKDGESKNVNHIFVAPLAGGEGSSVTRSLDRHILRAIWTPDSKALLIAAAQGTAVGIWMQPLDGSAPKKLDTGNLVASGGFGLDASISGDGRIALVASSSSRPAELFYYASASAKPERLTSFNDHIAALELGKVESIEWTFEGHTQDGVITYPPDYQAGRKYPLVLYIHGGPRSSSKTSFSGRAQLMAAQGWIVFEPNYRGSDNRGNAFQAAIWNDAGAGPGRDVMSGLEQLKKRGMVDDTKLAVSGWSYGGYMTTWLIGNYPGLWKAAVAGAAVTDLIHQYDLGDSNVRRGASLGGSPYTDPKRLQSFIEQSPMNKLPQARTPTLILALTGDYRVPPTQSYRLYHALRDNNVPVKFFAYPLPGHNASDPVHQRDIDRRWIGWLKAYLDGTAPSGGE